MPPPLLHTYVPPLGRNQRREPPPASTRISLSRGVAHGRVAGSTPAEGDNIFAPYAVCLRRFPATIFRLYPLELGPSRLWPSLRRSCPLSSPQSPPTLDLPSPSTALPRPQTLRRLAKPNTPAQYIYQKTHVYMFPNQTPPAHVALNGKLDQEGDSGSPVYVLRWRPGGYVVWAYGVLSGKSTDSTIVAPIDWIYVKVSVSR